jgi:arsenite methyltransferase
MSPFNILPDDPSSSCCSPGRSDGPADHAEAGACCSDQQADATTDIREVVKQRYGRAVKDVRRGAKPSCCGSATGMGGTDPITRNLYGTDQTGDLPDEAVAASFGCGNPTALAELRPGEVVLDLGSGGGIDVLLSARRVGPTGKAYGLDMTDEMLELAEHNKAKAGAKNVEFLKGTIENIPLPNDTVDVIISNCVINLSGDKAKVLAEAFRVLKPGGRFAVSDIVLRRALPPAVQASLNLWTGCVAGALVDEDYKDKLRAAGFGDVTVEPTRVYSTDDVAEMASSACCAGDIQDTVAALEGAVMSAFVRARKP